MFNKNKVISFLNKYFIKVVKSYRIIIYNIIMNIQPDYKQIEILLDKLINFKISNYR